MDLKQIQQKEDIHRAALRELAVERWREIQRLHDGGMSYSAIGKMYRKTTKQYIKQLLSARPK